MISVVNVYLSSYIGFCDIRFMRTNHDKGFRCLETLNLLIAMIRYLLKNERYWTLCSRTTNSLPLSLSIKQIWYGKDITYRNRQAHESRDGLTKYNTYHVTQVTWKFMRLITEEVWKKQAGRQAAFYGISLYTDGQITWLNCVFTY